ncbi:hypothetical protein GYMLUDRAFT_261808 [Collybiopsis luxurians FD-317 M1]|uniref:DUF6534 domain-containing protein n=1 Tax=Collybiopsis luxurians FD-317 M1 TaxID=944289 RepID=A0A0D0CV39_9AGAR|nr:hypothetical protein GYMLUDRAFT_261808 [Collybiopsis luxurians FD-317 M1]
MASNNAAMEGLDLGSTFGALEISTIISSILFGVVTTQTYAYHRSFPLDSFWTKIIVDTLWLVELGQTICTVHFLYYWSVIGYGNPNYLRRAPITLGLGVIFYGICVALVQGYFTYRLWRLITHSPTPYRLIPIMMVALISARFGVIIAGAVEAFRLPYYRPFVAKWRTLIIASQIIGACTDLSIMLTLVVSLRQRRVDAYHSTVAMVDKLILWAIETGALTSAIGITILICILTMRDNFIWLSLLLLLPKIFSNTLLANLNSRANLRSVSSTHVLSTAQSSFNAGTSGVTGTYSRPRHGSQRGRVSSYDRNQYSRNDTSMLTSFDLDDLDKEGDGHGHITTQPHPFLRSVH